MNNEMTPQLQVFSVLLFSSVQYGGGCKYNNTHEPLPSLRLFSLRHESQVQTAITAAAEKH